MRATREPWSVVQVEVEVADRNLPTAYHGQQAFAVQLSINKTHGGNVAFVIDRLFADNLQDATLLLVRPGNPDDLLLGVPMLRGQRYKKNEKAQKGRNHARLDSIVRIETQIQCHEFPDVPEHVVSIFVLTVRSARAGLAILRVPMSTGGTTVSRKSPRPPRLNLPEQGSWLATTPSGHDPASPQKERPAWGASRQIRRIAVPQTNLIHYPSIFRALDRRQDGIPPRSSRYGP